MAERRAEMLLAFGRAGLWAAATAGVLIVAFRLSPPSLQLQQGFAWSVAGGLLFGTGAAVNGGCSLSTLHRLMDGDRSLLLTIVAFCTGVFVWQKVEHAVAWAGVGSVVAPWVRGGPSFSLLLVALLSWCGREAFLLFRAGRVPRARRPDSVRPSHPTRLAAALLGVTGGVLYTVQNAWSYTNFLRSSVAAVFSQGHAWPSPLHAALVIALLAGMLVASRQGGPRPPRSPLIHVWRARVGGGFLMGIGGAIVPGGNDTLLLAGIPALSVHALVAYAALLAGIAITLRLRGQRSFGATSPASPPPAGPSLTKSL